MEPAQSQCRRKLHKGMDVGKQDIDHFWTLAITKANRRNTFPMADTYQSANEAQHTSSNHQSCQFDLSNTAHIQFPYFFYIPAYSPNSGIQYLSLESSQWPRNCPPASSLKFLESKFCMTTRVTIKFISNQITSCLSLGMRKH